MRALAAIWMAVYFELHAFLRSAAAQPALAAAPAIATAPVTSTNGGLQAFTPTQEWQVFNPDQHPPLDEEILKKIENLVGKKYDDSHKFQ